jgi:hypothetical protein
VILNMRRYSCTINNLSSLVRGRTNVTVEMGKTLVQSLRLKRDSEESNLLYYRKIPLNLISKFVSDQYRRQWEMSPFWRRIFSKFQRNLNWRNHWSKVFMELAQMPTESMLPGLRGWP